MSLPVYLVAPAGPLRDRLAAALDPDLTALDPGEAVDGLANLDPGLLLIGEADGWAAVAVSLAERVLHSADDWIVALVREGDDGPMARSLSLGAPCSLETLQAFRLSPSTNRGQLLDLRRVLREVSRLRHDLNNPLTAALAETQLLLMDDQGDEVRESLEVIQAQLRRLRDLIASSEHLRPPPRSGAGPA